MTTYGISDNDSLQNIKALNASQSNHTITDHTFHSNKHKKQLKKTLRIKASQTDWRWKKNQFTNFTITVTKINQQIKQINISKWISIYKSQEAYFRWLHINA